MTKIRNHSKFSEQEIDAARQLIQLSSGDSEEGGCSSCSNNNSYSVLQSSSSVKGSGSDVVTSTEAADDDEEGLGLGRRRNKRYRYVKDLYNVTQPLPVVDLKQIKRKKKCI